MEDNVDGWITLRKYLAITEETPHQVHMRVKTGKWPRGKAYSKPDGGNAWINIKWVAEWIKRDVQSEDPDTAAIAEEYALRVMPSVSTKPETPKKAINRWKAWVACAVNENGNPDEPQLYANSTGMDIPLQGSALPGLGPLTAELLNAKQFQTQEACQKWIDEQDDSIVFYPEEKDFELEINV